MAGGRGAGGRGRGGGALVGRRAAQGGRWRRGRGCLPTLQPTPQQIEAQPAASQEAGQHSRRQPEGAVGQVSQHRRRRREDQRPAQGAQGAHGGPLAAGHASVDVIAEQGAGSGEDEGQGEEAHGGVEGVPQGQGAVGRPAQGQEGRHPPRQTQQVGQAIGPQRPGHPHDAHGRLPEARLAQFDAVSGQERLHEQHRPQVGHGGQRQQADGRCQGEVAQDQAQAVPGHRHQRRRHLVAEGRQGLAEGQGNQRCRQRQPAAEKDGRLHAGGGRHRRADEGAQHHAGHAAGGGRPHQPHVVGGAARRPQGVVEEGGVGAPGHPVGDAPHQVGEHQQREAIGQAEEGHRRRLGHGGQRQHGPPAPAVGQGGRRHLGQGDAQPEGDLQGTHLGQAEAPHLLQVEHPDGPPEPQVEEELVKAQLPDVAVEPPCGGRGQGFPSLEVQGEEEEAWGHPAHPLHLGDVGQDAHHQGEGGETGQGGQ